MHTQVCDNETLAHNPSGQMGVSLKGVRNDMEAEGVEVMVLANPKHCQSAEELEEMLQLATRPRATHFFKVNDHFSKFSSALSIELWGGFGQ